jgi:hypothetical protein
MKNRKELKTWILSLLIVGFIIFLTTSSCSAINSLVDTKQAGYSDGEYTLSSVREYFIYLMNLILSLVGVLSLVAFVYGGITFLISAGSQTKITKGTEIIQAAVTGLIITFASFLIINLFLGGLGGQIDNSGKVIPIPEKTTTK